MVSVQQAAANALGAYLRTKLAASNVRIEEDWPDPDRKMALPTITIVAIGGRTDLARLGPAIISSTPTTGVNVSVRTQIAVCEQMFQLDLWANNLYQRDDICAQLDDIMNNDVATGEAVNGLLLSSGVSGDGWDDTYFDFYITAPDVRDAPFTTLVEEYRATIVLHAWMGLAVTRTHAKQAFINFKQRLSETDTVSTYDTTTLVG